MEKGAYSDYKCYCCKPEEIKMIKLGSRSYPYLAVAQNFNVEYYRVLEYVEFLERRKVDNIPYSDWRVATLNAYSNEMKRRRQVLGI